MLTESQLHRRESEPGAEERDEEDQAVTIGLKRLALTEEDEQHREIKLTDAEQYSGENKALYIFFLDMAFINVCSKFGLTFLCQCIEL